MRRENISEFKNSLITFAIVLSMFLGLTACAGNHRAVDPSSAVIPDRLYHPPPPKPKEGSIWPGDTSNNLLFVDAKARVVGDIVTVIIEENATSEQSATTDTSKDSSIDMNWESFLGLPSNLGVQNFLGSGAQFDPRVKAALKRANKGDGKTTREGKLTAKVSAMISQALPNGNFIIEGRRSVTVNNEEQIMILRGTVRGVDINFDNTISSKYIANASILYTGEGIVADEQRSGWLTRILAYIWPF